MHPLLILVVGTFLNFGRPEVGKKLELKKFFFEYFEVSSFFNGECWNAETAAKGPNWHEFGQNLPILIVFLKFWAKLEVENWLFS